MAGRSASWWLMTPRRFLARPARSLILFAAGRGDDEGLLTQDRDGRAVDRQQHVGADYRENGLVLLKRRGAALDVVEEHDAQADVAPALGEGFSIGPDEPRLGPVTWTDRHRKPGRRGEVPIPNGRKPSADREPHGREEDAPVLPDAKKTPHRAVQLCMIPRDNR